VKFQTYAGYVLRIINVILFECTLNLLDRNFVRKLRFLSNKFKEHVRTIYISTKFFT